ncbi:MAG: hypothetical protein Q7T16_05285 [Candidatus Burarchaeum sp.]|nr:hypothetical protein [Candidatus Burarchaeum sp.]MDO8340043.1 hypothetical protein [Candidatus Burarchaeum sp.]
MQLRDAAENVLACLGIKKGDRLLIIGEESETSGKESETTTPSRAIYLPASHILGKDAKFVNLPDFRRATPEETLRILKQEIIPFNPTASIFAASCEKGEQELVADIIELLTKTHNARHAHMPGITLPDFGKAFRTGPAMPDGSAQTMTAFDLAFSGPELTPMRSGPAPPDASAPLNADFESVRSAEKIRLETDLGTRLLLGTTGWKLSEPITKQGHWDYLPNNRISAITTDVFGTLAVCLFGEPLVGRHTLLKPRDAIRFEIENSCIVLDSVRSQDKSLAIGFKKYLVDKLSGGTGIIPVTGFSISANPYLSEVMESFVCNRTSYYSIAFGAMEVLLKASMSIEKPGLEQPDNQ